MKTVRAQRRFVERIITVMLLYCLFSWQFFTNTMHLFQGNIHSVIWRNVSVLFTLPIIIMFLPLWFSKKHKPERRKFEYVLILASLPYICGMSYTVLLSFISSKVNVTGELAAVEIRGTVMFAYRIFLASLIVLRFKEDAVDIFCEALILSYSCNIIYAFVTIGPANILKYLMKKQRRGRNNG